MMLGNLNISHQLFAQLRAICCLHLEMLFKVWQADLRNAVTADSTHTGLWFVQLSTQGWGLHSVFLPQCLGTSLAFTLTLSECPHHAQGHFLYSEGKFVKCLLFSLASSIMFTHHKISVHVCPIFPLTFHNISKTINCTCL